MSARSRNQAIAASTHEGQGCDQSDALYPSFNTSALIDGQEDRIVNWLSGAVKIPTEVFDVMGEIGEDPRWDKFYEFADCEFLDSGSVSMADAT
jgi:Gly-Xaa carboxypeptidase